MPSKTLRIVAPDAYTLNPGDQSWDALRAIGELVTFERTPPELLVDRCIDANVILSNKLAIDTNTIARLPNLKLIAITATGYNGIDTAAARARDIAVCNVPEYGTDTVAQFTLAMMLECCHRIGLHDSSVQRGDWIKSADWCYWLTTQRDLVGRTLGIIGFGRIGRRIGELANAFKMNVIAVKPSRAIEPPHDRFAWASLAEVFSRSDFVSLHCPLTPTTREIVNVQRLATMKHDAFLINISRGGLVDEAALAHALNGEKISGAAVDVVTHEPMRSDNPLRTAKNCIITPHIAWTTLDARKRVMQATAENVAAFVRGEPINIVN